MPLLHRQPFKALYVTSSILQLLVILYPTWTLRNLLPSWRPLPSWSLRRTLTINLIRWVSEVSFRTNSIRSRNRLSKANTEKEMRGMDASFVWIPPLEAEVNGQVGQWVKETGTKAVRLPAYWMGKVDASGKRDYQASDGEKVFVHFHGGAYITGSASPKDFCSYMPSQLLKDTSTLGRALTVDYRLSSSAPNPAANAFPAALVDALSAYDYVLSLGFKRSNIFISGDSAGGNLALALTRYLVDNAAGVPGGLVLFSPWSDLTNSHAGPDTSSTRNLRTDYLLPDKVGFGIYATRSFLGGLPASNPYISPASKMLSPPPSFEGFPRTYISVGGAELLVDQIRTLRDRMEGQVEGGVVYDEVYGAPHDFCVMWFIEPERRDTIRRIAKWIDEE